MLLAHIIGGGGSGPGPSGSENNNAQNNGNTEDEEDWLDLFKAIEEQQCPQLLCMKAGINPIGTRSTRNGFINASVIDAYLQMLSENNNDIATIPSLNINDRNLPTTSIRNKKKSSYRIMRTTTGFCLQSMLKKKKCTFTTRTTKEGKQLPIKQTSWEKLCKSQNCKFIKIFNYLKFIKINLNLQ